MRPPSSAAVPAVLALFVLGTVACSDDSPLPAFPRPDVIIIETQVDTLRIGQAIDLESTVMAGPVELRSATVRWRSTQPARVSVSQDGRVTALDSADALVIVSVDNGDIEERWPADTVAVPARPVRTALRATPTR